MLHSRAYKAELDPTKEQISMFLQWADTARFVFNWGLAEQKKAYEAKQREESEKGKLSCFDQQKQWVKARPTIAPWCKSPSWVPIYALNDVDRAFKNFFRRCKEGVGKKGFPRFKSRDRTTPSFSVLMYKVTSSHVILPKLGAVKLKESGYIPTTGVKYNRGCVSYRAGRWFFSAQVQSEAPAPTTATGPVIGVDLGIKTLAVTSDGRHFKAADTRKLERALERAQRELSRRKKGGKNREKSKAKVARLHYRIACARANAQHEATSAIVGVGLPADQRPSRVGIEDLNVQGMLKNHKLARAISRAGFCEVSRQIEYKAGWLGVDVVKADRWFPSSKTCSSCGAHNPELTLAMREWTCRACGARLDRDVNAAVNLAKVANSFSTDMASGIHAHGDRVSPSSEGNGRKTERKEVGTLRVEARP